MARIIAVADTFDAITTNRPYQSASTSEEALAIIRKVTGTKFDTGVVEALDVVIVAGKDPPRHHHPHSRLRPSSPGPPSAAPSAPRMRFC